MKPQARLKIQEVICGIQNIALVICGIAVFAWLFNRMAGAVFFCVAYSVLWYQFEKHSHCSGKMGFWLNIDWSCALLSIAVGLLGSFLTLPLGCSIISAIPVAILILWVGSEFAIKKDALVALKARGDTKRFSVETCTEQELIERCRRVFKRDVEYMTEKAIQHFIRRLPHEEIDHNPKQSSMQRYRMKKKLEK